MSKWCRMMLRCSVVVRRVTIASARRNPRLQRGRPPSYTRRSGSRMQEATSRIAPTPRYHCSWGGRKGKSTRGMQCMRCGCIWRAGLKGCLGHMARSKCRPCLRRLMPVGNVFGARQTWAPGWGCPKAMRSPGRGSSAVSLRNTGSALAYYQVIAAVLHWVCAGTVHVLY